MRARGSGLDRSSVPASKALRLLLVDDRPEIRHLVRRVLPARFEVVGELDDGSSCARTVAELEVSVVSMDCDMLVVAGDQATREVKEHRPDAWVIGFTSGAGNQQLLLGAGAGAVFDKSDIGALVTFLEAL